MTLSDYLEKWNIRFADNDDFEIDAQDLREFKDDTAAFLASIVGAGVGLTELVLPMDVVQGYYYVTSTAIWMPRSTFRASAAPVNGPNWRRVASFVQTVTAASILDASEAGRAILTTNGALAQLALLDNLSLAGYPALSRVYGEQGAVKYLLDQVKQLAQATAAMAPPTAPAAPLEVEVNDVSKEWLVKAAPGYPAYSQYKVAGLPGTTGTVVLGASNAYQVNDVFHIKVGSGVPKGNLVLCVAGSGNLPDGKPLTNSQAFTGALTTEPDASTTRDPYDVPAAKRRSVVDAGLPMVQESDPTYYGCEFADTVYGPEQPAYYKCRPSAPAQAGGATLWYWFRFDVL
jgi:hypothetical protein